MDRTYALYTPVRYGRENGANKWIFFCLKFKRHRTRAGSDVIENGTRQEGRKSPDLDTTDNALIAAPYINTRINPLRTTLRFKCITRGIGLKVDLAAHLP